MLSREIKMLAQLIKASAGLPWSKESAAAIHDTLMLMAVNAERLEAPNKPPTAPLEVASTASALELAKAVIGVNGLGVTTDQALALAATVIRAAEARELVEGLQDSLKGARA